MFSVSIRWRRHWKLVTLYCAALVALVAVFGAARVTELTTRPIPTSPSDDADDIVGATALFDASIIHHLDLRYDQAAYDRMLQGLRKGGDKDFIEADLVIDGTRLKSVGLRLKGATSQLEVSLAANAGVAAGTPAEQPELLPWLISFDEFAKNRRYQGQREIALRPSAAPTPASALNEALSLEMVRLAGEPSERFAYSALTINDVRTALRLVVEVPGDAMADNVFKNKGVLYKSLSTGRFRYLGEDPESYADSFSQVTAEKSADLRPVIDLVRWVTQASADEFAARLAKRVDTVALARYLAVHHLMLDADDMAGPGQNSYLWYDREAKRITIVTWDTNQAFSAGASIGPLDPIGPETLGGHLLKERFLATPVFRDLYLDQYRKLYDELLVKGVAQKSLSQLEALLSAKGASYIDPALVRRESDQLRTLLAARTAALEGKLST